ncbi:cationic amino acid transporter 2 isoform X1 [Acyrthosiphon pisum]|uniref:Cationic amino acid transporter C-terminal domain-containing protein n=2 Tax=Acyrthosiphon pisum TaxID=7029 RepID=A0A8R2B9L8_ACYPI|nr:cationic amino acid transporter 2 isoform X1 [Acyrthosiphon pisum]|eukprot:XP_008187866.1 PREDICTED: cationic amino acid transporter 2 isoform X1 [Acyrthosiphon pisum]
MAEFRNYKNDQSLIKTMLRRKKESDLSTEPTKNQLSRVLGLVDLISLGVGSTLGLGAYVLAGEVAVKFTGPAVVLSFAFAAVASALSGLCYAEFASRVPKAGSAYAFSYVGIGEIVAFLIGWDLILEYSIGCASIARALSGHIDKPFGHPMREYLKETFPMHVDFLAPYPDFFSFTSIIMLTFLIAWGMRESSFLNKIFTVVNLLTVITVVLTGLIKVDTYNWNIPKEDIPLDAKGGEGGFLPFGWSGVFVGAATCFYGFVGFDAIATTGEEAKRPTKDIPLAIVISLSIITLSYCSVAIILTLIWPYYKQDPEAPFPHIYQELGWQALEWIVTIGAVFALCTNMIGTLFPLPRILYSMASDGLLFHIFSKVDSKTKTPFWGTLICGTFAAILSSLFDLQQLMNMMSIGTLMAYSLVCICVLVLRYTNDDSEECKVRDNGRFRVSLMRLLSSSFNLPNSQITTKNTGRTSVKIILVYLIVAICFCSSVSIAQTEGKFNMITYAACSVSGVLLLVLCYSLSRQPQSTNRPTFHVPCVPFVPCLSVVLNIYLMTQLDTSTWIRFTVWLFIGLLIYLFYGLRNSVERLNQRRILDETYMKQIRYEIQVY